MIEANELRIGNIVEFKDPLTNEVERIEIDSDDFDLIYKKNNGHRYFPIPLSPEILEKAGFKQTGVDSLGGWFYYNIDGKMEVKSGAGGIHFEHGKAVTILHYVHELQNLYFALTGTDLSLQL